jgi:hypothetical protein
MENRIKEQQQMLFADRTSCHEFQANQFRLLLATFAYILFETFRRLILRGTEMERAQCSTIRSKLIKAGVFIRESCRRIHFSFSSTYPFQNLWLRLWGRLGGVLSQIPWGLAGSG